MYMRRLRNVHTPVFFHLYIKLKCLFARSFNLANCSLVSRLLSLVLPAFHTASDKSLGDKPGNEASKLHVFKGLHVAMKNLCEPSDCIVPPVTAVSIALIGVTIP